MTLGKRIKIARKKTGLSQREVAERLGISDAAVSSWERDETIPEFDKLPELIKILKVSAKWFIDGHDGVPGDDDPSLLWERLTPAQQRQAMRFLRMLADDDTEAA